MIRRKVYDINTKGLSLEDTWLVIREAFGPIPRVGLAIYTDLMNQEIAEYNNYVSTQVNKVSFNKWLIWKLTTGSISYGNFTPDTKNDHVGHCFAPCPYDSNSTDLRTRLLLGLSESDLLPIKILHEQNNTHYYMQTMNHGAVWGYQCSFPGCPYFTSNNKPYFYI